MIACGWNEAHSSPSSSPLSYLPGGGGKKKADGGISLGRKEKNEVGNRAAGIKGRWFFASQNNIKTASSLSRSLSQSHACKKCTASRA